MNSRLLASLLGIAVIVSASGCGQEAVATAVSAPSVVESGPAWDAGHASGYEVAGIALNAGWNAPTGHALAALAELRGRDSGFNGAGRDAWERGFIKAYRDRYLAERGVASR